MRGIPRHVARSIFVIYFCCYTMQIVTNELRRFTLDIILKNILANVFKELHFALEKLYITFDLK